MDFYPTLIEWPAILMRDRQLSWSLSARNVSGGRAISGATPMARMDGGGLWGCKLQDIQVSTATQLRCWGALQAALDGGATPVVVANRMLITAPWPTVSGALVTEPYAATCDDTATCDDGATFDEPVIAATLAAAAALRATTLTIEITIGAALQGGEYFSIEHDTYSHRLYQVATAVANDDGTTTITVRPPLREATAIDTRLDFDNPKCVMQLATPDEMELALQRRLYGDGNVRFIESFPPWA